MGTHYLPDMPPSPWQHSEVSGSVKSAAGHLPSTEIREKAGWELQCPAARGFNGLGTFSLFWGNCLENPSSAIC